MPSRLSNRPHHGDTWKWNEPSGQPRFAVMHVCGHHDPPHVTGYWYDDRGLDPDLHSSIPLPDFLGAFSLVEREYEYAEELGPMR